MNVVYQKKLFLEVEKLFTDKIFNKTQNQTNINFCCNDDDEIDIINMGNIIKTQPIFTILSFRDIFFVLIYIYYSLRYNEQSGNWLNLSFFDKNVSNITLAKKLYFDITTGDIIIDNNNFSSVIRRFVMEMKAGKIKKFKKCKKTLHKKNKNKKTKRRLYR
jgi:hypothetical protein